MISLEAIVTLIQIGRSDKPDDPSTQQCFERIRKYGAINREHWTTWDQVTQPMETDELIALTKGLTLAEKYLGWVGGSVAASIWTFRELQRRDSALADEVANWMLPRTANAWVPFGSQNYGTRSVEEFQSAKQRNREQIEIGHARQTENEAEAKAERDLRREQRQRSSMVRGELRNRITKDLAQVPIQEQLRRIAMDSTYSIVFYPSCIAGAATSAVIRSLESETRLALLQRLKGKIRGPWGRFKRRLLSGFPNCPWDRSGWFRSE